MRLGVLSDIHLTSEDYEEVCGALRKIVERFNDEVQPDAVMVLGDLIEEEDSEDDRQKIEAVDSILAELEAPFYYTIGNHDPQNLSREEIENILGQEFDQHIDRHEYDLILLDTTRVHSTGVHGLLEEEQIEFLRGALEKTEKAILGLHHPIHYHDISDNPGFATRPEQAFLTNKEEVQPVLENSDSVTAVLNGHLHEEDKTLIDRTPHFTVNAINKALSKSRSLACTHNYLSISEAGIELHRFDFKDMNSSQ